MKPRLLDLFCGAGGAAMGYAPRGLRGGRRGHQPAAALPVRVPPGGCAGVLTPWHGRLDVRRHPRQPALPGVQHHGQRCASTRASRATRPSSAECRCRDLLIEHRAAIRHRERDGRSAARSADAVRRRDLRARTCSSRHRLFESSWLLMAPATCRHPPELRTIAVSAATATSTTRPARAHSGTTVNTDERQAGHGHRLDDRQRAQRGHPARLHRMDRAPAAWQLVERAA